MTVDLDAVNKRITELRSADDFVRHLQGFAASTADMLEAMMRELAASAILEAANQRTIKSGDEAFRTIREQWVKERDELLVKVERLQRVDVNSRIDSTATLLAQVGAEFASAVAKERDAARAELALMRPVVEAAVAIRDNRYNIKSVLLPSDRILFDAFALVVDDYRASKGT